MFAPTHKSTMKFVVFVLAAATIGCNADPFLSTVQNVLGNLLPSSLSSEESSSTTCECGSSSGVNLRIINGQLTKWEGVVRDIAQIVNVTTNQIHGSGVIITERHILTAAHILDGIRAGSIYVAVGNPYNEYRTGRVANFTQKLEVKRVVQANYTGPPGRYNDIGIVELKNPIQFNQHVKRACLPKDDSDNLAGRRAIIAGWGFFNNNSTQLTEEILSCKVTILNARQCHRAWPTVPLNDPSQMCVDSPYQRAAQGDSGSPVQYYDESIGRYVAGGIVSFGSVNRNLHYPRVNTKISKYLDWIKSTVGETGDIICTKQ